MKKLREKKEIYSAEEYRSMARAHKLALKSFWCSFALTGLVVFASLAVAVRFGVAWFANNDSVNNDGMTVESVTQSNLVISKSNDLSEEYSIQDPEIENATTPFSVEFGTSEITLEAATHSWDRANYRTLATGLLYNTNPTRVSKDTGGLNTARGTALTFAPVPEYDPENLTTKMRYYVDYTVYVGTATYEMVLEELNLSFSTDEEIGSDYRNAASIDVYVEANKTPDISNSTYVGTLNLAGKSYLNTEDEVTSVNLLSHLLKSGEYKLPVNTEGYLGITIRFYFDGGLLDESGTKTYVRSNGLSIQDFLTKVSIEAVEKEN